MVPKRTTFNSAQFLAFRYSAASVGKQLKVAVMLDFSSPAKSASHDDEKVWSQILEDVTLEASKGTAGSVILLGDELCGKSSLVNKMVGSNRTPTSSVLEYNYLTVHANEDNRQAYQLTSAAAAFGVQDTMNLPVWSLDGNSEWSELMEFSLPKVLSKCVLVLCASLSNPEKIISSLNHWYSIAEAQIQKLYSEEAITQARNDQVKTWQEYVEPAVSVYADAVVDDFRPEISELEQGVLTNSCGAIVIVVLTKSDEKSAISSVDTPRLQYQLRKFCLEHGAALIYTSQKSDANTQLLRKYIVHRVYGLPFSKPAHIVDEDNIFIPAGWDSQRKLNTEREGIPDADQPLAGIEIPVDSAKEKTVECEDEQTFLAMLAKALTEAPVSPKREPVSTKQEVPQSSALANYFAQRSPQSAPAQPANPADHFINIMEAKNEKK